MKRALMLHHRRRITLLTSASKRVAVGIDLGTTSSTIALINEDGRPYILQDTDGKAMVPSMVTYTEASSLMSTLVQSKTLTLQQAPNDLSSLGGTGTAHFA